MTDDWQAKMRSADAGRRTRDEERAAVVAMLRDVADDVTEKLRQSEVFGFASSKSLTDPFSFEEDGVEIAAGQMTIQCRVVRDEEGVAFNAPTIGFSTNASTVDLSTPRSPESLSTQVEVDAWGPFSREGRPDPVLIDVEVGRARMVAIILDLAAEAHGREMESDTRR